MEQVHFLQISASELTQLINEAVETAFKNIPMAAFEPHPDGLWTFEEIALCSSYKNERIRALANKRFLHIYKVNGKGAIRYKDLEEIGVVVNPFMRLRLQESRAGLK